MKKVRKSMHCKEEITTTTTLSEKVESKKTICEDIKESREWLAVGFVNGRHIIQRKQSPQGIA